MKKMRILSVTVRGESGETGHEVHDHDDGHHTRKIVLRRPKQQPKKEEEGEMS
jgi:hypothetical protein